MGSIKNNSNDLSNNERGMGQWIHDENQMRELSPDVRLSICEKVLRPTMDPDESKRWDAVWLAGELAGKYPELHDRIAELMGWVMLNDNNGVVKHEAAYQIAARNMRSQIPALLLCGLNDESAVARHEALESLGLMRVYEYMDQIKPLCDDPQPDVRETAIFVLKRLERMQKVGGEYRAALPVEV